MPAALSQFDPTHVLLVQGDRPPTDLDTREKVDRTNAALFAALDRVDEVSIRCNLDWCADDFPDIADQLASKTTQTEADGEFTTLIGTVRDLREELRLLLDRTTHHRSYMIESITLARHGEVVVAFDPEHDTFELDTSKDPELAATVRSAVEETGARLVPGGVLAEWTDDGRRIRLEPPYLSESDWGLTDLRHLEAVTVEHGTRLITFDWADDHVGSHRPDDSPDADGFLGRFRQSIFPPPRAPPREASFDSRDAFEKAVSGFEQLSTPMGFELESIGDDSGCR